MTSRYQERFSKLESVLLLDKVRIDIKQLRDSCKYGITDVFRPLCWRLLLDYLPLDRGEWPSHLKKQRDNYEDLVDDIIVHPGQSRADSSNNNNEAFIEDHPLNLNPNSEWGNYFKDNEVLLQIDKDVRRLYPEIQFFQCKTPYPHRSAAKLNLAKRIRQEFLESRVVDNNYNSTGSFLPTPEKMTECAEYAYDSSDENAECHWQVVERILFIYSKLNPGVKYVQGMNEIIGPIYYVFANDPDQEWAAHAEADAYYCFQLVMSDIKDNFIKTLDSSDCGIEWLMTQFHERLRAYDPVLYKYLVEDLGIKPPFYAFRWLSLLLSQEFPLPDVITIWDSLFTSAERLALLQWICLAMLERKRDILMNSDFSTALRLLQNYREADVGQLIVQAYEMRENNDSANNAYGDSNKRRTSSLGSDYSKDKPSFVIPTNKIACVLSNAVKTLSKK